MTRFAATCLLLFLARADAWSSLANHRTTVSSPRTVRRHYETTTTTTTLHATTHHHQELILYNTKTRQKEPFQTLQKNVVSMYTCGPTVYDSAHVGNFRAFLTYDVLKRVLLYLGFSVTHICNLTDVDDKIITKCQETGLDLYTLTRKYEKAFLKDLDALNIVRASKYPRATEHIPEMVEMVLLLKNKGLAYQTSEGSWYFAVDKMEGYGQQLVQVNFDDMESSLERNNNNANQVHDKRSAFDFCLWKAYKPGIDLEKDATWETELGKGRPGWHLECSAMARKYLGDTIDVHCGGVDLTFPHHENEIAQSQGATSKPFCNCWIHNGFVNINDEKMSKSLGNFLTLRAACPTPIEVRAYRYLVVSSQYRNPLSFTPKAMNAAKSALKRMDKIRNDIANALLDDEQQQQQQEQQQDSDIATKVVPAQIANFEAALLDDLSMPRAAACLFACVKAAENEFKRIKKAEKNNTIDEENVAPLDLAGLRAVQEAMDQMDEIFGIFYKVPLTEEEQAQADADAKEEGVVPDQVRDLVEQRTAAKDAKDWELADSLRTRITELGFAVKDVKGGEPIVSRVID